MSFIEWKFTAYSGTSEENFRDCAFVSEGRVFYKKVGSRFYRPEVYYTSKMSEAAYYAKGMSHYPLIMAGQLHILRRLIPGQNFIQVFPIEAIYVPDTNIDDEKLFDENGHIRDLSPYFKPITIQQILS